MQGQSNGDTSPANQNHPGIDWSGAPPFGRRQTLLKALQRLYTLHPGPACIVETGTLRDDQARARDGDGWSTLAWGWYAAQTGSSAHTVDISPEAMAVCRRQTEAYAAHLVYTCGDSIAFLRRWGQEQRAEIHLLYLDSLDYIDHDRSERHHLEEARAALPLLAPCCLVLLDDTTPAGATDALAFTGKGARAIPFLLQNGFRLEWCEEGQALLSRGTQQPDDPRPRSSAPLWQPALDPTSLNQVPGHFTAVTQSSCLAPYLAAILKLCPPAGRTCEAGVTTGYAAVWLSLHGREALGITGSARGVERARQVNNILRGSATFRRCDLLDLYQDGVRYDVIHHQGVIHRFTVPVLHAILAQQVASAERVVFSVPSVYHAPVSDNTADEEEERLLPIEEWRRILAPFQVLDLRYDGAGGVHAGREHLLCVLTGQPVDALLRARMQVPAEPYPQGISAIVHTRNEAHQLADCLETLTGWTDEIIVCDMESEDGTVGVARRTTANILSHPLVGNLDQARNASALRARYRWIVYLDADERIPRPLGDRLRELCLNEGDAFEALSLPFLHGFAGCWMQSLYPGYKAPSLFKNGRFYYQTRLHAGARVHGRVALFSTESQELAPRHHSYRSLAHYLDKLNRYTDTEADNLRQDGARFHWRQAIDAFVHDFQGYYGAGNNNHQGSPDGVHGFLWAFLSGFYRFMQHAKLFEGRYRDHQLAPAENEVPASLEQMLEYALAAARRPPQPQATPLRVDGGAGAAEVAWCGPLLDPSGYGEECRNLLLALADAEVVAAGQAVPWSGREAALDALERRRLQERIETPVAPGFTQIVQTFAPHFQRHPQAGTVIGRTMFETDRLPPDWVGACNRMDAIWVPSEFNRGTFREAGVQAEKLAVIPGCLNPAPYTRSGGAPARTTAHQVIGEMEAQRAANRFLFLSLFDWTRHKGWDTLLRGFLEAFEGRDEVALVLKVWSSLGYTDAQIRQQAADFARQELGHDLAGDPRIRFVPEYLTQSELILLYRASDAFVLPSRGEGWGRPYMEAMACGLPTIGTGWSGNTAFMTADNSYLLNYELWPVPEAGWRELPAYRGHRWAEPDLCHLKEQLRRVVEERGEALGRGRLAREEVTERFSRAAVGKLMVAELARLQECRRPHPVPVAPADMEPGELKQVESEQSEPKHGALTVRWEGAQLCWHSLAHVNRELCLALLASGSIELAVIPTEAEEFSPQDDPRLRPLVERAFQPLSGPAVVHIRHQFPPRLDPPEEGHFVLIQPWEFGYLPKEWIEPIREQVTEVWCYSRYVRDVYLASGIPAERLHIVPLGVGTDIYRPTAPPYLFTTEPGAARLSHGSPDPFVFLYVGGTISRKGFDILLEAYLRAFSAYDEVCLVIKDTGTNGVYRGQNAREEILRLAADPHRARILYVEENLTAHRMAGIYTAADCLVAPYRGEGFCLPALEAMACGLPVVVPEGGPTDDFVDETVGWRLAAERRPVPGGQIGSWECAGEPWTLEVEIDALARQMSRSSPPSSPMARSPAATRLSSTPATTPRRRARRRNGCGMLPCWHGTWRSGPITPSCSSAWA